jgi:hypothetical protein
VSYADLLKDPRWQKRRLEVLADRGWKCERCDDKTTELHVHHKRYLKGKMPWEYEDVDLCVLCSVHHEQWHKDMENLTTAISYMPLPAFENLVGYAVALASYGGSCFRKFVPKGCNGGGLIVGMYVAGKDGQKLIKESTSPEGTIDVPRLISESLGTWCEKTYTREQIVEEAISLIRKLANLD